MTTRQRRRVVRRRGIVAALGAVLALTTSSAGPADAQVFGVLTIDPESGPVGTVVTGTVAADNIAASCAASAGDFVDQLNSVASTINERAAEFTAATWPDGMPSPAEDAQAFAALLFGGTILGISTMPDVAESAWQQAHVLTFADIATQQPTGELSSFDPATGVGEVTVPEVDPGAWAVAATCLQWNADFTVEDITAAVAVGTAFVEANLTAPYPTDVFGDEFAAIAAEAGPAMLANTALVPGELWVSLFEVTGPGGPGPGPGPGPGQPPTAPPATPVPGDPDFTG